MKIELNNLKDLKKKNPFKVPDGYMQSLTSEVMAGLPEKAIPEVRKVSLMDRVRPWVYMAAMFAGLGLFFNYFVVSGGSGNTEGDGSLTPVAGSYYEVRESEDLDYLEFIETQYEGVLLAEEWRYLD